jgi:hypothetical protein
MRLIFLLFLLFAPFLLHLARATSAAPDTPYEIWLEVRDALLLALRWRTAIDLLVPDDPEWPAKWRASPGLAAERAECVGNGAILRHMYENARDYDMESNEVLAKAGLTCMHVRRGKRLLHC